MKAWLGAGLVALIALTACSGPAHVSAAKSTPPAKVEGPGVKEADLASITLTPEAEQRLGIRTAAVGEGMAAGVREFAADLMLPTGRSMLVTAPVSGTLKQGAGPALAVGLAVDQGQQLFSLAPLLPLPRDLRVTAEADVEQAKTRVETAKLRVARAEKMLKDEVGTVRALEDARNELDLSNSALNAARARLDQIQKAPLEGDVAIAVTAPHRGIVRQLLAVPGQPVSAGTPLFEIADLRSLWVRVPVYAGEAHLFRTQRALQVVSMGGQRLGSAAPVQAPPTADPLASTVDFYYEIGNASGNLKPGEKVLVQLPSRESKQFLQVPWPAIVFDTNGGAWLYEKLDGHRYARRRVDLDHTSGGVAYLRRGAIRNALVVTDGAAELWGTEFGAGK